MYHLVNDLPYVVTLCGLPTDTLAEDDYTDSLVEAIEDDDTETLCAVCKEKASAIVTQLRTDDDEERREEIAREEGMLNGINSYNDWREDFHSDEGRGSADDEPYFYE